ncbi:hypothetical protein AMTRI_Chr03g142690 [Amborella trichopoda]
MVSSPEDEASPSTSNSPKQTDGTEVAFEPEEALQVDLPAPRVTYTSDQQKVLHVPIAFLEAELTHQLLNKVLQIPSSLNKEITGSQKKVLHFSGVVEKVQADKSHPSGSQGQDPMAELRSEVRNLQSQLEIMHITLKHLKGFFPETKTYDELKTNSPRIKAKAPPDLSIYNESAHRIMRTMNYEPLSNQILRGEEATAPPFEVIEATAGCHKMKQGVAILSRLKP